MERETLLYAVKVGAKDWQEEIITTKGETPGVIEAATEWAKANGFNRFRVSTFDVDERPDFVGALNGRCSVKVTKSLHCHKTAGHAGTHT